jgi:glutaredoxin-related protein
MYILGKLIGGTSEILEMHERGHLMKAFLDMP